MYRKYHTLSGANDRYTVKRYLWPGSITEYPEKDLHVDFLRKFYALPKDIKKRIVDCMELPEEVDFHEAEILLMNSPKWTKAISGLETPQHYLPYLLIADYYFDSKDFLSKTTLTQMPTGILSTKSRGASIRFRQRYPLSFTV